MDRIQKRFEQLAATADEIEASKSHGSERRLAGIGFVRGSPRQEQSYESTTYLLDVNKFLQWFTSVQTLLDQVFGNQAPCYARFEIRYTGNRHEEFDYRKSVFLAAKDDYENGFANVRALISADVFSDELEQADELLTAKYKVPAAVVAGTVLESTIRALCDKHDIPRDRHTKLNKMNDDLAKEGEYNNAKADQIRAWAKIRNDAAHGHPEEFTPMDVKLMIDGIRDFVANQLC